MKTASKPTADADIQRYMLEVGQRARAAARAMARAETAAKDTALMAMAAEIERQSEALIAANRKDIDAGKAQGLDMHRGRIGQDRLCDGEALGQDGVAVPGVFRGPGRVRVDPDTHLVIGRLRRVAPSSDAQ